MANYETLKSAIQQVVKTNGNNEITGALLQQSLLAMINSLGAGYQFMGVATPTTNPGTIDQKAFYIADTAGDYSNFGGIVVANGEIAILKYNDTWTKETTNAATASVVNQLKKDVDENAVFGYNETSLRTDSPYYVSTLSDAWIFRGKIQRNEYTSRYLIYLFRVPAGKYKITRKKNTGVFTCIVGTIESIDDFVPGGSVTPLIAGGDDEKSEIISFDAETYMVILSKVTDYNAYVFIYSLEEITVKVVLQQCVEDIEKLKQDVNGLVNDVKEIDYTLNVASEFDKDANLDDVNNSGFIDVNLQPQSNREWRYGQIPIPDSAKTITFNNLPSALYSSGVYSCFMDKNGAYMTDTKFSGDTYLGAGVVVKNIPDGAFSLMFVGATAALAGYDISFHVDKVALTEQVRQNTADIAELKQEIQETIDILIPNKIYAIVGTELNLWNDAISLSVDNSLYSPRNYVVEWSCSKGIVTKRGYRFNPVVDDIGSYNCTCKIFDSIYHKQIATKTFTIKVVGKNALSSAKKIVHFGDSLGESTAAQLYNNFNNSDKFTGSIPTMIGTHGTDQSRCEAVGGWTWASYATAGTQGFRIYVSGVTSIGLGAVYSDGSHNFAVYEVNISDGAGNCLIAPHYSNPGTLIMPSGTLTKVSGIGDNTVPYTGAYKESVNPLWNDTTNQLDITQYKQMLVNLGQMGSVSEKIDAVSFQFGVNESLGTPNLNTILNNYIIPLYNLFVSDNPNCKFIVGLTTSAGNDVDGAGANYGASRDTWQYLKNTYNFRKMYLEQLQDNTNLPNLVIAPSQLQIDRYYGYAFSTRPISQRTSQTEQYHNNFVHPGEAGYGQLADALFATYIGSLTE